jgi:hypothetical protein
MDVGLTVSTQDITVSADLFLWSSVTFSVSGADLSGKEVWLHVADGRRPLAWQRQRLIAPVQLVAVDDVYSATVVFNTSLCQGLFGSKTEEAAIWLGLWDDTDGSWLARVQTTLNWAPQPHGVIAVAVAEEVPTLTELEAAIDAHDADALAHADLFAAASSSGVSDTVTQAGHAFAVGNVLRTGAVAYELAQADTAENAEAVGIVSEIDGDDFVVVFGGKITLTDSEVWPEAAGRGDVLFLSETTAGLLTLTEPQGEYVSKPMVVCLSTTEGIVLQHRGVVEDPDSGTPASEITVVPAGNIEAVTVQEALEELDSEKAATGHNHDEAYDALGTAAGLLDSHEDETTTVHGLLLHNLTAVVAPTAGDDAADGYAVGSRWIDTVAHVEYVCMDPAAGAAVWESTTGAAGVGGSTGAVDNAILRADGADGATLQAGSLTIEDASTETQANVQVKVAHAGQTNSALVLTPMGNGALVLGARPDGTVAGGNARGEESIDTQRLRQLPDQVASGQRSVMFASVSSATTGDRSACIATQSSQATGSMSLAAVGTCIASGTNSVAVANGKAVYENCIGIGPGSKAYLYSSVAHASGVFATDGDAQAWNVVGRTQIATTDATPMTFGTVNVHLAIPAERTWYCTIRLVARQDDGSSGYAERRVCIQRTGTTTALVGTVQTIGADAWDTALGTPTIAITADDTNERLVITITQANATATRWVASVDAVEVGY